MQRPRLYLVGAFGFTPRSQFGRSVGLFWFVSLMCNGWQCSAANTTASTSNSTSSNSSSVAAAAAASGPAAALNGTSGIAAPPVRSHLGFTLAAAVFLAVAISARF
jgi:hypothetical protein